MVDNFDDDELEEPVLPPEDQPVLKEALPGEPEVAEHKANYERDKEIGTKIGAEALADEPISLARLRTANFKEFVVEFQEHLNNIGKSEEQLFERAERLGLPVGTDEGNHWFRVLMGAVENGYDAADGFLDRTDADWRQHIDSPTGKLFVGTPKMTGKAASPRERSMQYERKAGVGINKDVPLYHSGIWLRFYTPPAPAQAAIQQAMGELKLELGRITKGLAFSNTSHALMSLALDACLQAVVRASVHYGTPSDLKAKISILDAPAILWGVACTIWPQGYDYAHPCTVDPTVCQHIQYERLNLQRMFWTDNTALTDYQRKIMSRRLSGNLTTDEELAKYVSAHVRGGTRDYWMANGIGVRVRAPDIQTYEEAGNAWIDGIVEMTQSAFNEPPHGINRNQYITRIGQRTSASQYRGWVVANLERDEDDEIIVDTEEELLTITLDTLFSSDEYLEAFLGHMKSYIDDTVISTVAIDTYDCPACSKSINQKPSKYFPHLVQIDVLMVFFTLIDRKLN